MPWKVEHTGLSYDDQTIYALPRVLESSVYIGVMWRMQSLSGPHPQSRNLACSLALVLLIFDHVSDDLA